MLHLPFADSTPQIGQPPWVAHGTRRSGPAELWCTGCAGLRRGLPVPTSRRGSSDRPVDVDVIPRVGFPHALLTRADLRHDCQPGSSSGR